DSRTGGRNDRAPCWRLVEQNLSAVARGLHHYSCAGRRRVSLTIVGNIAVGGDESRGGTWTERARVERHRRHERAERIDRSADAGRDERDGTHRFHGSNPTGS